MSKVSVVIPALNEEEPITAVVRECLATGVPDEVIVVDNGSSDRTADRARSWRACGDSAAWLWARMRGGR